MYPRPWPPCILNPERYYSICFYTLIMLKPPSVSCPNSSSAYPKAFLNISTLMFPRLSHILQFRNWSSRFKKQTETICSYKIFWFLRPEIWVLLLTALPLLIPSPKLNKLRIKFLTFLNYINTHDQYFISGPHYFWSGSLQTT